MNPLTKKAGIAILTSTLLVGAGGAAWAAKHDCMESDARQEHRRSHKEHKGMRIYVNNEVLKLTDEQKTAIKDIRKTARAEMKASKGIYKTTRISSLNPGASDYMMQVEAIAEKKSAGLKARMIQRAQTHAKIFEILTPEQQEKLLTLQQNKNNSHHGQRR